MVVFWMILLPLALFAAEISVEMSDKPIEALQPLPGLITVRHLPNEAVEADSFQRGEEPLQVEPLGEEKQNGALLSRFRFWVTAQEEGLQMLPPISAIVGSKRISAPSLAYQVKHLIPESALELRAFVFGERPFYPGERLQFVYRIYYRGEVELTKEVLPLIRAEGFRKIGSLEVDESEELGYHVQSFIQRAEALKAGEYAFDASLIEGIVNGAERLQSKVAPFTLTVLPFPQKEQPLSFTGAIGAVELKAELKSALPIAPGEILQLQLDLRGENLQEIDFPNILCMPGFAGNFVLGGLPTAGVTSAEGKTFLVELRPINAAVQAIPPFFFASYLPETRTYEEVKSAPIPIKIQAPAAVAPEPRHFPLKERAPPTPLQLELPSPLPALSFWPTWPLLFLPLLGVLFVYLSAPLAALLSRKRPLKRAEWVDVAARYERSDPRFYQTLSRALEEEPEERLKRLLDQVRYGNKEIDKETLLQAFREAS